MRPGRYSVSVKDAKGVWKHELTKETSELLDFKRVASEAKHRKGDEPEPGPKPEPNGEAAAS